MVSIILPATSLALMCPMSAVRGQVVELHHTDAVAFHMVNIVVHKDTLHDMAYVPMVLMDPVPLNVAYSVHLMLVTFPMLLHDVIVIVKDFQVPAIVDLLDQFDVEEVAVAVMKVRVVAVAAVEYS